MFSPKTKRTVNRILPFGLIWLLSGWVFLLIESAVTGNFENQPETAIRLTIPIFVMASIAVFSFGLLTGWLEYRFIGRAYRNQSFILRIILKLLTYWILFTLIILISFPIAASMELQQPLFSRPVWDKYAAYFFSITHLSSTLQLSFSLLLSLFYYEISDYIGQKALWNFLTGKYHQPVEEERVFMFLDMRSSTRLAEQMGHTKYFTMLRRYYNDLSAPILQYAGEVYQYAGDEVIVSWPLTRGLKGQNCILCFLAMRKALRTKIKTYKLLFGEAPWFKAGIHAGKVTTGEIGQIKKEILFTGDVLNTCARIQGLCNTLGTDLLLSADIVEELKLPDHYPLQSKGVFQLKGRDEPIELYSLSDYHE